MALLLILQLFFITFMTFFIAAMVHLAGAVGRQGGGDFGTPLEHECGQAMEVETCGTTAASDSVDMQSMEVEQTGR